MMRTKGTVASERLSNSSRIWMWFAKEGTLIRQSRRRNRQISECRSACDRLKIMRSKWL